MVASPLKLESTPPTTRRHPPLLGEHTDEVLREVLGCSDEEIAALKASGAVR
jgi:crotonobetainyl-CoA:carnitine CoA-transferase CaiB-like acyl-CoA transferase